MRDRPSIAAVVLAAGASTRLGRPKQLMERRGRTLLRNAVEAARGGGCRPVVVVVGAQAARMRRELEGLDVRIVENHRWRDGLGGSIARGVAELLASEVESLDGVMLLLCDQPDLSAAVVRRVSAAWRKAARSRGPTLAACEYAGTLGPPAVFSRAELPRLAALAGDRGAKAVLLEAGDRIVRVKWERGALDVDRPEDCIDRKRGL